MKLEVSSYDLAQRFVGVKEAPGASSNPQVLAMLRLDSDWPEADEVAWCSAFVNYIAWLLRLPRSKSLSARSWLNVGTPVALNDAQADNDVVILERGPAPNGHVGFYAGLEGEDVLLLGGNQGDAVTVARFPRIRVIGVRRLT